MGQFPISAFTRTYAIPLCWPTFDNEISREAALEILESQSRQQHVDLPLESGSFVGD